jgi:hypothetical protein
MSNFKEHQNNGIISAIIVGIILIISNNLINISLLDIILPVLLTYIYSLFPDIDVKSVPSKFFYSIITALLIILYIYQLHKIANIIAIISIIPQLVKHRGVFHNPITAVIIPTNIFYIYYIDAISFQYASICYLASVFGYIIHLLKDTKF